MDAAGRQSLGPAVEELPSLGLPSLEPPLWRRLWWWVLGVFVRLTPESHAERQARILLGHLQGDLVRAGARITQLAAEVDTLVASLARRERLYEQEVDALRIEGEFQERKLRAEVDACQSEMTLLAEVLERDRKRVEAETASYASAIARQQVQG